MVPMLSRANTDVSTMEKATMSGPPRSTTPSRPAMATKKGTARKIVSKPQPRVGSTRADTEAAASLKRKLQAINLEINELEERVGADALQIERVAPRGQQLTKHIVLPDIVGFDMLLEFIKKPTPAAMHALRWFLRSGGVIPQLFLWIDEDGLDSGSDLREALQERLPLSPWSNAAAQSLSEHLAHLASLLPSVVEAQEPNASIRRCVEYTRSLRTKNQQSYLDRLELSEHETNLFCSTVLLVAYRDYTADSKDGFFAVLLHSWLVRPMYAELRQRWEAKFPLLPLITDEEKVTGFEQNYRAWMEEKEKLEAEDEAARKLEAERSSARTKKGKSKKQHMSTAKPSNDEEIEESEQHEPVPDLTQLEPPIPAQMRNAHQFMVPPRAALQVLEYTHCIETSPFTDVEKLLFLKAFLEYKQDDKRRAGLRPSIARIAEVMPRRSPVECIHHHYARKSRLAHLHDTEDGSAGQKRAATAEMLAETPPGKTMRMEAEQLYRNDSPPIDSAFDVVDAGFKADVIPPPYYVPTETVESLKAQLKAMGDREKRSRKVSATQLAKLSLDFNKELARRDAEMMQLRDENETLVVEAEKHQVNAKREKNAVKEELKAARKEIDKARQDVRKAKTDNEALKKIATDNANDAYARTQTIARMQSQISSTETARKNAEEAAARAKDTAAKAFLAGKDAAVTKAARDAEAVAKQTSSKIEELEQKLKVMKEKYESAKVDPEGKHQQAISFSARLEKRDRCIAQLKAELERHGLPVPSGLGSIGPPK